MGDNQKRRSILFPFGKSAPKETGKFEVVNRKKNPASNLAPPSTTTASSSAQSKRSTPSPFDSQPSRPRELRPVVSPSVSQTTKSSTSSNTKPSTLAPQTKVSSSTSTSSSSKAPHRISLDHRTLNPLKSSKSPGPEAISPSDLPLSNLNVNVNVPPVPDYNSTLYAPPVTIKGRSVSLAKKEAPPRRKPPPMVDALGVQNNGSTSALSMESQRTGALSFQNTELEPQLSNDVTNGTSIEETGLRGSDSFGADADLAGVMKEGQEAQAAPAVVVTGPLEQQKKAQGKEGSPANDDELNNVEEKVSELNLKRTSDTQPTEDHAPTDARREIENMEPIEPPTAFYNTANNLSQADSFESASDFMDARENQGNNSEINLAPKETTEAERQAAAAEEEDGDDPDSSFEVKPLFFHKKTRSTASEGTARNESSIYTKDTAIMSPPSKTHKKELSLSDDILKDIEDFQSAIPSHVQDENDEVSPVSPLALQKRAKAQQEPPPRSALYDEISDQDKFYAQNYEEPEPQRQLVVKNPGTPDPNDSLFQDSSSDEIQTKPYNAFADKEDNFNKTPINGDEYDYAYVGGLNQGSRDSSVLPEIDYHNSSLSQKGGTDEKRLMLTDEEDEGEGYEQEFNKFAGDEEYQDELLNPYEFPSAIPRSQSLQNIPNDVASHNERSSYNSNVPSQFRSSTSDEDNNRRDSVGDPSDQASSNYNYYSQGAQTRRFHVVNTGDYSDDEQTSSRDQYSYNPSFDQEQPESLNQDYSVIHQQITNSSNMDRDSDEEGGLSFTAKSPVQSEFNFESKGTPQQLTTTNLSDIDLSQPSSAALNSGLGNAISDGSPVNSYDRREDTVAPVQYVSAYNGATRRPPPLSDAPKTTRVARSMSTSVPLPVNYNTLQEATATHDAHAHIETHEPERSSYVEMLRMSSGTANSDVSPSVWGLPIGIADIDHSKLTATSSRTAYKRAQRTNKSDLKHGKIKQRLLASEVDDDDTTGDMGSTVDGQSIDLDKSRTPSIHSPTQSVSNFSPNRAPMASMNAGVSRSGTLMGDKIGTQLGRSGSVMSTVKPVNNMTLFIANPDIEEDD